MFVGANKGLNGAGAGAGVPNGFINLLPVGFVIVASIVVAVVISCWHRTRRFAINRSISQLIG